MTATLLGLSAATLWGVSDFLGGVLARQVPVLLVALIGPAASLVVLAAIVLGTGLAPPSIVHLIPALLAGLAAAAGLPAFFYALAIGTVSVAAPIAATGVAIPVAIGLLGATMSHRNRSRDSCLPSRVSWSPPVPQAARIASRGYRAGGASHSRWLRPSRWELFFGASTRLRIMVCCGHCSYCAPLPFGS